MGLLCFRKAETPGILDYISSNILREKDNRSLLPGSCSIKVIVLVMLAPPSGYLPIELLIPVHKLYGPPIGAKCSADMTTHPCLTS